MLEALILTIVIPALVGAVVSHVMGGLKKVSEWLATRPAWMQQIMVGALATGAVYIGSQLGIPLPADILNAPPEAVGSLLTAGFAFLYHFARKKLFPTPTA